MKDGGIRCLIVDDQALVRSGLAMILEYSQACSVAGELDDGEGVVAFCREQTVDVVLMDIRMRRVNGIEATQALTEAEGLPVRPRILALTTFDLDEYAVDVLRAGASGFLLKDAKAEEVLSAIEAVHRGEAVLAPTTTRRLLPRLTSASPQSPGGESPHRTAASAPTPDEETALRMLSPREREVFELIGDGLSNPEIMERLFVSEATVKTHVNRILAKLSARDRVQLVVLAQKHRTSS